MDFRDIEELNAEILRRVTDDRDESDGENADRLAFTRIMIDWMTADGGWNGGTTFEYSGRGMHASGYAFDETDPAVLDVFVSVFLPGMPSRTMPTSDIDRELNRGAALVREVLEGRRGVERFENGPAADLSALLDSGRNVWETIRIVLVANARILSNARTSGYIRAGERVGGAKLEFQIWDLDRMFRLFQGGRGHEPVTVDFPSEFGALVPCLELPKMAEEYSCCLAVFPGDLLADVYERYGTQLLEKNVRVFLQERGKVNKGILKTIETRPQMFLAFNNGISITAKAVEFGRDAATGQTGIRRLEDFQIVNGGQTTASLHNARKKHKLDLSKTFVQAKISIVGADANVDELVRDISFYANSQNKIKASDPASGGVFHIALEQISKATWTPNGKTRWYYERMAGQYAVDKEAESRTVGGSQRFERERPKSQRLQKTDVAKILLAWQGSPEVASLGGEKCFQKFSLGLRDGFVPDETFFKTLVAKAIIFKTIDGIVKEQGNTEYKANVVAYTMALLNEKTENRIDLLKIWERQAIPEALRRELDVLSQKVRHVIETTAKNNTGTNANVTEWAKKDGCWEAVQGIAVDKEALFAAAGGGLRYPDKNGGGSIDVGGSESTEDLANRERVDVLRSDRWTAISQWGHDTGKLNDWNIKFSGSIAQQLARGKRLSIRQVRCCCKILDEMERCGVDPEGL